MTPAEQQHPWRLMGVVNVTPDSFSDGGLFFDADAATEHGLQLAREGAHIVDFGGESTRPGSLPVSTAEELRRVLPPIERLRAAKAQAEISIDTSKASVAAAALAAGASFVNDITALRADRAMAEVVAAAGAHCCLMHMQGEPRTMQIDPRYDDVVSEVKAFLEERMSFAVANGVPEQRLLLDPGIGFGKTAAHNLALIGRIAEIAALGRPIVIGTSRKSFIGRVAASYAGAHELPDVRHRLPGTIATNVLAFERGATVFRVHDIAPVRDALAVAAATLSATWTSPTMSSDPTR